MAHSPPNLHIPSPPPPPPPPPSPPRTFEDSQTYAYPISFLHRTRLALHRKTPQLKDALQHSSSDLVQWVRREGFWRAFLVIFVGGVVLLALSGCCACILFFVTATVNALAIGFLASVVAFAVPFFVILTAICIGSLITAIVTISVLPFFTVCAALTAAGWFGFVWVPWQGCTKGADLCRRLVLFTTSAATGPTAAGPRSHEKVWSYKSHVQSYDDYDYVGKPYLLGNGGPSL